MFFRGEKIVYVSTTSNTEISLKYLKKNPAYYFIFYKIFMSE